MAETHRQRLIEEMEQIRLEDLAVGSRYIATRFFCAMFNRELDDLHWQATS
jgi:hypothetical protein